MGTRGWSIRVVSAFSIRLAARTAMLCLGAVSTAAAAPVDFNRDIRPVLSDRCFACHGPDAATRKAGLRLDEEAGAKAEVIVPGQPDASTLIERISATDADNLMPPADSHKPAFTPEQVALFRRWIAEGAPWAQHWAFEKPQRPEPPAVQHAEAIRQPLDAFVLAKLEKEGLSFSPEAPRETLIRRLYLDLVGLPPTPEEVDSFLADTRPDAYERLVDQLLASPHYGERMALDWLDGARYADTNGYQNDFNRAMWPWRDWVINAFNANMPFDQFAVEQLAGDLLPNATDSQRVATGFLRNNRSVTEAGSIEEEWHVEKVIDRVETTNTVFLGITMGCARCHDHKYDPISQREFYQFYAFFNASEDRGFYEETRGNTGPKVYLPDYEQQMKLAELEAKLKAAQEQVAKVEADKGSGLEALKAEIAAAPSPLLGKTQTLHVPLQGDLGYATPDARATGASGAGDAAWVDSLVGRGIALSGAAEAHVDLGQALSLDRNDSFTISLWLKAEGGGSPISKMDDEAEYRGFDWLVGDDGAFAVHLVHRWPDNALKVVAKEKLPMGRWTHVCVTYNGSAAPDGIKIFFAGKPVAHDTEVTSLTGSIQTEEPLRLGRRSHSAFFKGALADLRVFNRFLPDRKVEALLLDGLKHVANADTHQALLQDFVALRGDSRLAAAQAEVNAAQQARDKYLNEVVPSVMVMQEAAEPRPTYRLVRGQYTAPDTSELLSPATPAFLPPMREDAPRNRLGLAQWIVSPDNPLTARVAMNRLWNKFFGQGLVKTLDNFGMQSELPLHQDLLDWLAEEFIASGWDLKAMQKRIVTSAVYRQASAVSPELLQRDPGNTLLARGPRFRLQAELIRDNALAIGGLLTPAIGGPSVKPYQPEGLWAELAGGAGEGPYVQATGADLYRRSLYTYRKRTVPHPTTAVFDAPSWELCTVYRARTNTPLQALALLNDTTYVEAARKLAERMLLAAAPSPAERLQYGFRLATGRRPTTSEAATLEAGLSQYLDSYAKAPEDARAVMAIGESPAAEGLDPVQLAAYAAVAGVLLNLDETITRE
jgi:hypothetical protein